MDSGTSLLLLSRKLRALARGLNEGQAQRDEESRFENALQSLEQSLSELTALSKRWSHAVDVGIITDETVVWTEGSAPLRKRADEGRPTWQALNAARTRMEATRTGAEAALNSAWQSWARSEIDTVDAQVFSYMTADKQQTSRSRLNNLKTLAQASFTSGARSQFVQSLAMLREDVSDADPQKILSAILTRLHVADGVLLGELAVSELLALRADAATAARVRIVIRP